MTIRRTHKDNQKKFLDENQKLNILDLGCAIDSRWKEANHFADIFDFHEYFEKKKLKFTKIEINKKLPFKDKEFDYVILSHVLEHIPNPIEFIHEVERIGKSGYIEIPTRFNDSIVIGNEGKYGHRWWFNYDDDKNEIHLLERLDPLEKFISVGTVFKLTDMFQESFTLQLYWENKIPLLKKENILIDKKLSFLSFIKKFYSKKIRDLISKIKLLFQ